MFINPDDSDVTEQPGEGRSADEGRIYRALLSGLATAAHLEVVGAPTTPACERSTSQPSADIPTVEIPS